MNYLDAVLVVCAYLFGSFPYMLLRARMKGYKIAQGEDFHLAFMHKVGLAEGIVGIAVDVLKGIVPIIVGFLLGFNLGTVAAAGLAGVAGQMWPVFQKFDGEKGNTAGLGMAFALTLWIKAYWVLAAGIGCAAIGVGMLLLPRLMKGQTIINIVRQDGPHTVCLPVGMLCGFSLMPLVSWLTGRPVELTVVMAGLVFIIALRRLTADIDHDIRSRQASMGKILLNRFLLDRSYL